MSYSTQEKQAITGYLLVVLIHLYGTSFRINHVESSTVSAVILFNSNGNESPYEFYIRPIVSLESNVKIDTRMAGKDGSSPDKAWVIK